MRYSQDDDRSVYIVLSSYGLLAALNERWRPLATMPSLLLDFQGAVNSITVNYYRTMSQL